MGRNTLIEALEEVYRDPLALQSNYVRDNSHDIARLASTGLITVAFTVNGLTFFGNKWRVTEKGLGVLRVCTQKDKE